MREYRKSTQAGLLVDQETDGRNALRELAELLQAFRAGDLNARADLDGANEPDREVLDNVNQLLDTLTHPWKQAAEVATRYGEGDFSMDMDRLPGQQAALTQGMDNLKRGYLALHRELKPVLEAAQEGQLETRADASLFKNSFKEIADGVNHALDAVSGPLQQMAEYTEQLSRGATPTRIEGSFRGGFRDLGDSLNRCVDNINALIEDAQMLAQAAGAGQLARRADASRHHGDYRKVVESVNQTLDAVILPLEMASESASALSACSEALKVSSQHMVAHAHETSTQAEAVATTSEQVSSNVEVVAAGAEEMQASIREIARSASESARVARDAVKMAEGANGTISKLGDSSTEIGKVIKVITSIAQQTNLLALNATIEAARAGEAGRGFAVVANEVKELAKETAKATEDISQKIEAIQGDTKGAITAIGKIAEIIHSINEIANSIAAAVEQQAATTSEIGRHVNDAARGTGEISRTISIVASVAREATTGATDTQDTANALSRMAADLQALLAGFTFY